MNETEMQSALEQLRGQLTGNLTEDMIFLQNAAASYEKQGETELPKRILELAMEQIPPKQMEYLRKVAYIGERPLDLVYAEAVHLMQQRQYAKALELTEQIYQKIAEHFKETPERRFFSFRNLLESNLYYHYYHPTKRLEKTPFDFPRFLTAHAYNLVELGRAKDAIPVLELAIRFNPMNADPRFELAEIYKQLGRNEDLLNTVRETLPVCTTPYALARCYANIGYYCTKIKAYEDAICFYFESMVYADNPMIVSEMRHVSHLMDKKLTPPTRQDVLAAFEKHDVMNGPAPEVLGITKALAQRAEENQEWEEATFYFRVLKDLDLLNSESVEADLNRCQEALEQQRAEQA